MDERVKQIEQLANSMQNVVLAVYVLGKSFLQIKKVSPHLFRHDPAKKIGMVTFVEMKEGELVINARIDKKE